MLPSQRVDQYNLILRHGNAEYAQLVLARPLSDDRHESKLWTEIGIFLASVEALDDADQAFARALHLEPKNRAARHFRRKLKIARPLDPVSLEFLSERLPAAHALSSPPEYLSTTLMTDGFGSKGEVLSRHVFVVDSHEGLRQVDVVSKEYAPTPDDSMPKEIGVAVRASKVVRGETLRLPRYYGHCRNELGRYVLFIEAVDPGTQDRWANNKYLRAQALGELAGLPLSRCRDLTDFLRSSMVKRGGGNVRETLRFCATLQPAAANDILRLYEQCEHRLRDWNLRALDLPQGLAHGDAHAANLLIDASGRVVLLDLAGMKVAPVGFDLATLIMRCCRDAFQFEPTNSVRTEATAVWAFLEGARRQGAVVYERDVRAGMVLGNMHLVNWSAKMIKRRAKNELLLENGESLPMFIKGQMDALRFLLSSTLRNLCFICASELEACGPTSSAAS